MTSNGSLSPPPEAWSEVDTPLWKQCADWICRLGVLPSNHKIMWPDADVEDLAFTLRDGVLLCHIQHALDPSSVDMRAVNQRPQMAQFLCLKNIRIFLTACKMYFDMKETDLFQPSMLYDYSDFARVMHTLSKLSNCPKAKGIAGFPAMPQTPTDDEEQIYRTLEDMVNEDKYEAFYYRHQGGYGRGRGSQYYTIDQEEDIYEDLCSFKSRSSRRMQAELNFQPKEKREYCIKELVETEGNYVDVLNMLRKHFIRAITSIKEIDKKIIFMNIKDLGESHAGFYQEVLECVTGKSRKRIGEIFLEYKERFLKYGDYCSELPRAQETLDALINKDDNIRDEIARCEKNANDGRFKLRDLLAVPMQRILKYHLLLRELVANTTQAHEEYHTIQQAYEAMLDVSEFINEVKRDSEQLTVIKEIQNSITDWNMPVGVELKDYGRLRKDSELKIQSHETNGKTKVRYVFVFDKVLLMCKATRGDHYSFKDSLKLQDYKVQDVAVNRTSRVGRDSRWAYSFMLAHHQNLNAYTLFARTEEDKNKWVQAIREALSNVFPNQRLTSTHTAVMFTFEKPSSCDYCHRLLKGLFYQGYRCEKCGRSMHRDCISLLSKCGTSQPPALPPRPPSMQLPTASAANRFSQMSLDETSTLNRHNSSASITSLPSTLQHQQSVSSSNGNPDYINTRIEDHTWYVGDLEREAANGKLAEYPCGTFIVRRRAQGGGYALSLKTSDDVKHMKICSTASVANNNETPDEQPKYFLSDTRMFRSVVELVTWYSRNSLKECFTGLDMTLRFPLGELTIVQAQYEFSPNARENNMLALKPGEKVAVIDKAGENQGWWKAFNGVKIGYIPKDFVTEVAAVSS